MILLTVGVNDYDFTPLFDEMDAIAPSLGEDVTMQTGGIDYSSKNCRTFGVVTEKEMQALFDEASLVICHAGIGTVTNVMKREVPMVVVPRSVITGDGTDQQTLVADRIVEMGRGIRLDSVSELKDAIEKARGMSIPPYVKDTSLCDWLSSLLDEYSASF